MTYNNNHSNYSNMLIMIIITRYCYSYCLCFWYHSYFITMIISFTSVRMRETNFTICSFPGLEEAGFGSQSACNILVAEDKRGLVGYVLYYYCYSWEGRCVCVEDMYVRQSKGHEDVAEALWRNLVKVIRFLEIWFCFCL